jgi:two-component system response regulator TtrR
VKHTAKVFVIDNDPAVLASLEAILAAAGYDVRCFTSAQDFLAQYHPTQVGCLLVDLKVPGSELLQRLDEAGSLLSVVIISGLVDSARQPDKPPAIPILIKPFEASTLLTMVEDAIAGSVRRRAKSARQDPRD